MSDWLVNEQSGWWVEFQYKFCNHQVLCWTGRITPSRKLTHQPELPSDESPAKGDTSHVGAITHSPLEPTRPTPEGMNSMCGDSGVGIKRQASGWLDLFWLKQPKMKYLKGVNEN